MDNHDFHRSHTVFSEKLGKRLQQLRWKREMSQEQVAYNAGISVYTYQKYEKGESKPGTPMNPQLFTLLSICDVFDIDISDLLNFHKEVGDL